MAINPKNEPVRRGRRRTVVGVVSSDKMAKTIVVDIERLVRHPKFEKYLRKSTRCYAHDEKREAKIGDRVEIMETRPLSRLKRWRLVRVVLKAPQKEASPAKAAAP